MANAPNFQRVICVIECPAADDLLRQHCAVKNKEWRIAFEDLMEVVALVMEGNENEAFRRLEYFVGIPLFHPAHYGRDSFSQPATDLVTALALALKHALPHAQPNQDNLVVRCTFLQTTGKWFVFDVVLQTC